MMPKLLTLVLLCISSFAFAQVNHCVTDRYGDAALFDSLDIERDVYTYSIEERWPATIQDTLEIEVFKPSASVDPLTERPFILMIHGGAFIDGDRSAMNTYCMEMARRGYVAATMDYRLGWNCTSANICGDCSPEAGKLKVAVYRAMQDANAALRFSIDNASLFGIDTSAIFLQGESAGAIAALHSAFWDQTIADAFCTTCDSILGPLDDTGLAPIYPVSIKAVVNNCGALAMLNDVTNPSIPVIGFHDDNDCIVPFAAGQVLHFCGACGSFFYAGGSESVRGKLSNNGICYNMNKVFASAGHCTYPSGAVIGKASCFLKSILCNNCTSSSTDQIYNIPDCSAGTTSVGLPSLKLDKVKIFPNPTQGEIRIRTYSEEVISVELIAADGRTVQTFSEVHHNEPINFKELESGVYTVKINQPSGEFVLRKIVLNP